MKVGRAEMSRATKAAAALRRKIVLACRRIGVTGVVSNEIARVTLEPYVPADTPTGMGWRARLGLAADAVLSNVPKPKITEQGKKDRERRAASAARAASKKAADDFYASWEWKRVRYEALKIHGRRCQCCGWQPGDCDGHLVVDHIKPRRRYPELELELSNLQVLCNDCNMGKGAAYEDDFRSLEVRHRATIQ
jgi:5-methylcytosine-specific restriction endonuclease McrA